MKKLFFKFSGTLLVLFVFTNAQSIWGDSDTTQLASNKKYFHEQLTNLLSDAKSANKALKASESRIKEVDEGQKSFTIFDAPKIEVGSMDATTGAFPNPFKDQMQMDYSIEQMIMFPSKVSNMKRAEEKKKDMMQFDKSTKEKDIELQVQTAFFEIYTIDRQMEINQKSQSVLSRIVDIARTQYEVGMGKQADILRAQTELTKVKMKLIELKQRRNSMVSMINALRDKPLTTHIDSTIEITPPEITIQWDDLKELAVKNRSELKSMQANVEMKKAENASAKYSKYPDFMVRFTYSDVRPMATPVDPMNEEFGTSQTKTPDRWSIMVGATIPFAPWAWNKSKSEQKRTQASITTAQEELGDMKNMIESEVYNSFTEVRAISDQLSLTKSTLLPQAQQSFESALASYKTGGKEFVMLLDTEQMLFMAWDDYQMSVMNYLLSLAKLARTSGIDFFNLIHGGNNE